jgi:aspartyl/asparaginyl beta-hydroxylase (cupin superfamily)
MSNTLSLDLLMRQAFFSLDTYPELEPVLQRWREICSEAQTFLNEMIWIEDDRTNGKVWAFAPLQPEEEDRDPYLDALSVYFRSLSPLTVELVSSIPTVLGYGFSLLLAKSTIGAHSHSNPFVTAMLGLSVGGSCWIKVGPETRQIQSGEMLIFDYSLSHEVYNQDNKDRLVLLILLPNKSLNSNTGLY